MKKFFFSLFLLVSALSVKAADYEIYDIDINVLLREDGSAAFTEVWKVHAGKGTEWYLVKRNLGDIGLMDFNVSENGVDFIHESDWDIDRSISEKAGRCGTVNKGDGYELCWGLGSYGDHTFTVSYTMSNAVKALNDYDMLHLQLVSPGLSAAPEHVRASISAPVSLGQDNAGIWGFGYEGTVEFSNGGSVCFESSEQFRGNSSMIVLLRFDKGIFNTASIRDCNFEEVLDRALDGASFSDDEQESDLSDFIAAFLSTILCIIGIIGLAAGSASLSKRRVLGMKEKDVDWCRDIPFGGDIFQANYVLERLGENRKNTIASAIILRLIKNGQILVTKGEKDNVELSFNESAALDSLNETERGLYDMMKEASGKDVILQKNEFSRWSRRHTGTISKWAVKAGAEGRSRAAAEGNVAGSRFTEKGQAQARNVVGFRKFLKDFTLLEERGSAEVGLWHDYLVFAALYGIADTVAKELKDINPQAFEEIMYYDYNTTWQVIRLTRIMADSITNARAMQSSGSSASRRGFGGVSSFGGGGGFSGGGFGGGGR